LTTALLILFALSALQAYAAPTEVTIDLSARPFGDPEYGWTVNGNDIRIFGATDAVGTQRFRYTILRSDFTGHSAYRIRVTGGRAGQALDITLQDVNIDVSGVYDACAFDMTGSTVNLRIIGENKLLSGPGRAGLEAPSESTLYIDGTGSLFAAGGNYAQGAYGTYFGTGGGAARNGGAGIGGGSGRGGGDITIAGASVTACGAETGDASGAGIGGGYGGAGGYVTITGGVVRAYSSASGTGYGAGIGGGYGGAGAALTITGGDVAAYSSAAGDGHGAGIGGGATSHNGGTIIVTGGKFAAKSADAGTSYGADIGGGERSLTGNRLILTGSSTGDRLIGDVVLPITPEIFISRGNTLIIPAGASLTVPRGGTLNNNGRIENEGVFTVYGTLKNDFEIENTGRFTNEGVIDNIHTIYNSGLFDGLGVLRGNLTVTGTGTDIAVPVVQGRTSVPAASGRVRLDCEVKGTHATVLPLADANRDVNMMIDFGPYLTTQRTVDIDFSGLGGVKSVSFPVYLLEVIGDAGFALDVKLPAGEMQFSVMAAKYLARHILGEDIDVARVLSVPDVNSHIKEYGIDTEIVIRLSFIEPNVLSVMQRSAVGNGKALDASLSYKGGDIYRYDGAIKITAPYTGRLPVSVRHLGDLKKEELIASTYDGGRVSFNALRLSYFALGYEGTDNAPYTTVVYSLPYTDVNETDWFYEDALWAYRNEFVSDTREFSPGASMTRAMLVTMLWRMAGEPNVTSYSNPFTDVGTWDWFRAAAVWAAENGVISGRSGRFEPYIPVTRQEFAAMLLNYAAYENKATFGDAPAVLDFADADTIASYAVPGVAWCYEKGIVQGRPGKIFDPDTRVSRAEMVALLHRYAGAAF
jgi:hypothetical protein